MKSNKFFISRNYKARFSAAGKAKIDCEIAFEKSGIRNVGLTRSVHTSQVANFLFTLIGTLLGLIRLKRSSVLFVQYPTKKYYNIIVAIAKFKKCKVVTIVHDLRSHRKQKVSVDQEINWLNKNDVIISHNKHMTEWLTNRGLTSNVVNLNIFDYLCDINNELHQEPSGNNYGLVFAGVLEKRKNGFLYLLDEMNAQNFSCNLYGIGFNQDELSENSIIDYKGVFPADEIVSRLEGDFGIVWDGISIDECKGSFGEYLKINNPHKTSMYLRAGLPVIIWDKAAMASFVRDNNVGIPVTSLAEVDHVLRELSLEDYKEMKKNAQRISRQLNECHFMKAAIDESLQLLK